MSTSEKRGPGRPKGAKNTETKPSGKQLSVWLPAECAARAKRLKGESSYGAMICQALKALEQQQSGG